MNQIVIILAVLSVAAIILAVSKGGLDPDPAGTAPPAPILLLPDQE